MKFSIYSSNVVEKEKNCLYPLKTVVTNQSDLKDAVSHDYVCAQYKNNYRGRDNFLNADCLCMDCDNTYSENPRDWLTPEKVAAKLKDVGFAVHYSRHHMKPKNDWSARPRFHIFVPIDPVYDIKEYVSMKNAFNTILPYFDKGAMDGARFFFGTEKPVVEIFPGTKTFTQFLEEGVEDDEFDKDMSQYTYGGEILEGSRNSTMSHCAGKILKRFGETEEAHEHFLSIASRCKPPLDDNELATIWHSARKFYRKIASQPGYIGPEKYNRVYALRPEDYSDIGQAKVLAREYAEELAYTEATDYMRFDGTRWVESRQFAVGACEEFLELQLEAALVSVEKTKKALLDSGIDEGDISAGGKTLEKKIEPGNSQAYLAYCSALAFKSFVMKRRDMKYIISALQAAKPMLLKNISEFDNQEFLLNTPAATYDLRTGISGAREHAAGDLITKITTVSPGTENEKLWRDAVNNFFCGDQELIEYVQQIVGLSAIGKTYMEALIISYGQGSNGKSTFWNAIAKVLGSYSGTISADALTVGCKRNVKPEVAELKGKRLVIAAELEEGMRLNTSTVKQLCSTDEISAEKKYRDPFAYTPTHTLVLYTNHLPRVGANDDGTWRRVVVIPFKAKIEGSSGIKNYAEYLVEKAGGAILAWIIDGARKVIFSNFHLHAPACVKEAIEHYRDTNDWLSFFIEECCELNPSYVQKSGEFYQEYRAHCSRNGEYIRSTTDFYTGLEVAGFRRKKLKTGSFIYGLRLKSEFLASE